MGRGKYRRTAKERALALGMKVVEGGKATFKPEMKTNLDILVPKAVAEAIDGLYEMLQHHFVSRNEFLEEVLKEGLNVAVQAQHQAIAALEAAKKASEEQQRLIQLPSEEQIKRVLDVPVRSSLLDGPEGA